METNKQTDLRGADATENFHQTPVAWKFQPSRLPMKFFPSPKFLKKQIENDPPTKTTINNKINDFPKGKSQLPTKFCADTIANLKKP